MMFRAMGNFWTEEKNFISNLHDIWIALLISQFGGKMLAAVITTAKITVYTRKKFYKVQSNTAKF